jgi:D-glycerate 3-kinase
VADAHDLAEFIAAEGLPEAFQRTLELVCEPLAIRSARLRQESRRTVCVGLCGSQGSGKTTIAEATRRLLAERGLGAVAISLDDFYLIREARERLAAEVHPLLSTRGPPGTHDVGLACAVLDQLSEPGAAALPHFDKAADTRAPRASWRKVRTPVDVVILEGWCVGAVAQGQAALARPVNDLEREEDAGGIWRGYVNDQLAGPYQELFGRLDDLVLLAAPGFEVVAAWRGEQEAKLRARTGGGMEAAEVARFVGFYERLTRWILAEMPSRAGWTVELDAQRRPLS